MQTESIDKLAAALAKAQGEIGGATKGAINPHFKSKYADLASVVEAVREPFAKNGLSFYQPYRNFDGELRIVTRIAHSSGEWLEDDGVPLLLSKQDMQGLGSASTYARRYGLMAAAGVAPEDDDGNAAVGETRGAAKPVTVKTGTAKRGTANGQTERKITLTWADGKTRDFPATKHGALEAIDALEKATATNIDHWHCNQSQMIDLAGKLADLCETEGGKTFAERVQVLQDSVKVAASQAAE